MNTKDVARNVAEGLGRLNYEYEAEHDGAYKLFGVISLDKNETSITVVTEDNRGFRVTVEELEE